MSVYPYTIIEKTYKEKYNILQISQFMKYTATKIR